MPTGRLLFFGPLDALDGRCVDAVAARGIAVDSTSVPPAEAASDIAGGYAAISVKGAGDIRADVLRACPSVRGIALRSRELRTLDPALQSGRWRILVMEGLPEPVGEFTVALLLGLWRLPRVVIPNAGSDGPAPRGLSSARLGLVGLGRIGRLVAAHALALGLPVCGWDRERVGLDGVAELPLDEVLARSTILSLHLPLDPSTRHLIGEAQLARLPRGAILINTARAGILDEAAVLRSLEAGHLAAAALDVAPWDDEWGATDVEHRVGRALRAHPRVCATPHVAFATDASELMLAERFADNVAALLSEPVLPA